MKLHISCSGAGDARPFPEDDVDAIIKLCDTKIQAEALKGLLQARDSIAKDTEMSAFVRSKALDALTQQIERWQGEE